MTSRVARRYARAIFALAQEGKQLQPVADELGRLGTLAGDPAVLAVLKSPTLSLDNRAKLADALVRELALNTSVANLVRLLAQHHRLGELAGIRDAYQALLDIELGRVRITLRSARPLEPPQHDAIVAAFAIRTGKTVIPTVVVDPELLGGIQVEVGNKVFDGSVRTQLDRLAHELVGTSSL
ncbi:ATP synthase F1 subunit delta [Candidatus Binatia bacterium]|nr:ATP synthase F1 subunit delta [Candidatus Binatia bacterium]